jgi:hypothetical protein
MNMSGFPFSFTRSTSPVVYQGGERVSITVRLEPEVAEALFYASAKRKVSGVEPFTQQDIVGEALREWLRDAGFFPAN